MGGDGLVGGQTGRVSANAVLGADCFNTPVHGQQLALKYRKSQF